MCWLGGSRARKKLKPRSISSLWRESIERYEGAHHEPTPRPLHEGRSGRRDRDPHHRHRPVRADLHAWRLRRPPCRSRASAMSAGWSNGSAPIRWTGRTPRFWGGCPISAGPGRGRSGTRRAHDARRKRASSHARPRAHGPEGARPVLQPPVRPGAALVPRRLDLGTGSIIEVDIKQSTTKSGKTKKETHA